MYVDPSCNPLLLFLVSFPHPSASNQGAVSSASLTHTYAGDTEHSSDEMNRHMVDVLSSKNAQAIEVCLIARLLPLI